MALCPNGSRASGETATRRACLRSRNALTSRLRFMRSARQVQQAALLPGRVGTPAPPGEKCRRAGPAASGVRSDKCRRFNSASRAFEIIAHQRDRQVGGALDDANAQLSQRGAEFLGALHVDRLDAHATVLQIAFSVRRRQPEARPIGGGAARRGARRRNDVAAVEQAASGLRGSCRQGNPFPARERSAPKLLPAADCGGERAVELAVKKELPVLGIEAHDIGRQHIDGEIRRELRNVFAVALRRAVSAFACPEASTRASTLTVTSLDRHCKARILHWSGRRRRARALVRWI